MLRSAEEPRFELLIGSQGSSKRIGHIDGRLSTWGCRLRAIATVARCRASHQSAVIPPVKAQPWSGFPRLILQVRRLIELFVVVNAEGSSTLPHRDAQATRLRWEEARGHARHHYQRRESVELRHAHSNRVSRDLGIVPSNRKEDRRRCQRAEIIASVRVLPNVVPAHNGKAAERLLQARMEVIAIARVKWCIFARDKSGDDSELASAA